LKAKDKRLQQLRATIPEITPTAALNLLKEKDAVLLDIRDPDETAQGSPRQAIRLPKAYLELNIEEHIPDLNKKILIMCASGMRSLFAADALNQLGYQHVSSLAGGFTQWKNEGFEFEIPPTLNADARERYSRHLLMANVGEQGQLKLLNSKVLCIGAGGIGSPVALYLAAAGVGTLGIVDHDVVDRSNLQRQILHSEKTIGMPKVESASLALQALNPNVKVIKHQTHLDSSNVEQLLKNYDVIVDGSDNIPTRYLVNDACVKLGLPNVHGAVFRFEGQVTVFWPAHDEQTSPCYRCLFPTPPTEQVLSCAQAGVLGVLPGVIGLLQAVETIKLLLNIGRPLTGRILYYDALEANFRELKLKRKPDCLYCGATAGNFPDYDDYTQACASALP